jgi:hypothetical protein
MAAILPGNYKGKLEMILRIPVRKRSKYNKENMCKGVWYFA